VVRGRAREFRGEDSGDATTVAKERRGIGVLLKTRKSILSQKNEVNSESAVKKNLPRGTDEGNSKREMLTRARAQGSVGGITDKRAIRFRSRGESWACGGKKGLKCGVEAASARDIGDKIKKRHMPREPCC